MEKYLQMDLTNWIFKLYLQIFSILLSVYIISVKLSRGVLFMSFIHDFLKPRDQVENMLMGGSWHGSGIALSRSQFIRFAKFFKLDKEVKSGRMKVIKYNNIPVWQK